MAKEIAPATKEEIAAHAGASFNSVQLDIKDAIDCGILRRGLTDAKLGIITWVLGAEGERLLDEEDS